MNFFGQNPYRNKAPVCELVIKILQYIVGSVQMAGLLYVPAYRDHVRSKIRRPVDLMVVGAQKSGTTWLHTQLARRELAAVSPVKECHHFDRGRCWTVERYWSQFRALPPRLPIVEVAPDYGPLPRWRIRAIKALFPELRIGFIARNPVERAWSGTKMETAFDRGRSVHHVPVKDFVDHLRIGRSRRYGDYAGQITSWRKVFGDSAVSVYPFEMISREPYVLIRELLEAIGHKAGTMGAEPAGSDAVFSGESAVITPAVRTTLLRCYLPEIDRFAQVLGQAALEPRWASTIQRWKHHVSELKVAPEQDRKLLYICGFCPNPNANSSGQKLAYRKVLELSEMYHAVRLIYFVNRLDALDESEIPWPENVEVIAAIKISNFTRIIGALRFVSAPFFVSARLFGARRIIKKQIADPSLSDFYADFSHGLGAISAHEFALWEFRQHDIVSLLYERLAHEKSGLGKWVNWLEARRVRVWEEKAWSGVAKLITLTNLDATRLRERDVRNNIVSEPVRGTFNTSPLKRSPATIVRGRIGFWGNMARRENVDAVTHMALDILPAVRKVYPDVQFWIIGAHPTEEVQNLAAPGIHVTGFVADPGDVFATLKVAVVPLRIGSGVKIKVFETIDAGIPTVVTPVGGEGIEDHPLLRRAQTNSDFIAEVLAALRAE